jgi:6-phosphofructokinase 2
MTGGATGRLIEELLDEAGVAWQALPIRGRTRISLNVHDRRSGLEYRFVPAGPEVTEAEWRGPLDVLRNITADWIVASGSLPRGMPIDFYAEAATIAARRGQKFVLDTSGAALKGAIGHGLALLKLSLGELEYLVGRAVGPATACERETTALIRAGAASMIAVSLGRRGAILATAEGVIRLAALPVEERSAVGAGDSFLAGLVLGLARGVTRRDALAMGIGAGAATVANYGTARVERASFEALYQLARGEAGREPVSAPAP